MSLKEIGEFDFIKRISRGCLIRPDNIIKAIGDDAAAFTTDPAQLTLITTDLLVERIHFLREAISGFDLGYKSLAVNLSDIAAMGGTAKEAFISIAIPDDCQLNYLESIYDGIKDLAVKYEVNVLGGDTTRSKVDLVINIVVQGIAPKEALLCRDAAQPGDVIFSTGFLGDSKAGLHLILNEIEADTASLKALLKIHRVPEPHLREGRFLARQPGVHAAIDTSDGLSSDLAHIAEESRVGACLQAEKIPISENLRDFGIRFDLDPLEYALSGGEDYTLLATAAPEHADKIANAFKEEFGRPLFAIGAITVEEEIKIVYPHGEIKPLALTGWDHFKAKENE
jgi:thiamine-monophosphate kinase